MAISKITRNKARLPKDVITATAGLWSKTKETGLSCERLIRKDWNKRMSKISNT